MLQATNNFTLVGNIVKKPEIKATATGRKYAFVVVAINKIRKGDCNFISILLWDKLAENAVEYFNKGDLAAFVGSINSFKRNDRTDIQLTADAMTFLRRAKTNDSEATPSESEATPSESETKASTSPLVNDNFVPVNPDPFAPY